MKYTVNLVCGSSLTLEEEDVFKLNDAIERVDNFIMFRNDNIMNTININNITCIVPKVVLSIPEANKEELESFKKDIEEYQNK